MKKSELREIYRIIRGNIIDREKKDKIIFNKIIENKKLLECDTVLVYVSTDEEVDTRKVIEYLFGKKRVAVPKIENGEMNFYYIDSFDDLERGYFGIMEPCRGVLVEDFSKCVSITPGICFSVDRYRVGYGGGFYDKFYDNIGNDIYKIGVSYGKCLVKKINIDKYDVAVDEIITD